MQDEINRLTGALPAPSSITSQGTNLRIDRRGNPAICVDARLLDGIEAYSTVPKKEYFFAGIFALAAVGCGLSLLPAGVWGAVGFGWGAWKFFGKARSKHVKATLLLCVGDTQVALVEEGGLGAANRIAESLSPYTRTAEITTQQVYQNAKRRLRASQTSKGHPEKSSAGVSLGGKMVTVADNHLVIGGARFAVETIKQYAKKGKNIRLPQGELLQAALALLVIAAKERHRQGEDLDKLATQIARYESWSGNTAGR